MSPFLLVLDWRFRGRDFGAGYAHRRLPGFGATPASANVDGTAIANDTANKVKYLMVSPVALAVEFGELDLHATQQKWTQRLRIFCGSVKRRTAQKKAGAEACLALRLGLLPYFFTGTAGSSTFFADFF